MVGKLHKSISLSKEGGMLAKLMEYHKLTLGQIERLTGIDKTTLSLLKNGKYNGNKAEIETQVIEKLKEFGYTLPEGLKLSFNPDVFVFTQNVLQFKELADELLGSDLTSSFGIVAGRAGRGKTKTAIWYAVQNQSAVYVLYVDGMTIPQLAREICFEITGLRPRSFYDALIEIEKTTKYKKRLVIIDEADKMPKKHIEMLRGLNERCQVPIMLLGEEVITSKLSEERRLKSRVRKIVTFEPISVADVSTYYQASMGINLDPEVALALWKRSQGDFRIIVRDAYAIYRMLKANETTVVTMEMVQRL